MKTILKTLLIAVAAFLIQTSTVKGQSTYQTAQRFSFGSQVSTTIDSNNVLQPGVGTGCALTTKSPSWILMGACATGNASLRIVVNMTGGMGIIDTVSVIIYGPFTDTLNLISKLNDTNIDTCYNKFVNGIPIFNSMPLNYQRGDIYLVLIMSTYQHIHGFTFGNSAGAPFMENDSAYCPLCDGKLSELHQSVCTVTYDSASQKNKILWTKDIFTAAQDYVFYRKNAVGTYDTLGFQSISQLSEYVDATSSPIAKPYEYRLSIRDSCGQFTNNPIYNPYAMSFTTMHLIAYPTGNNSAGLLWNAGSYGGPFLIYRTDPSGITTLIDSVGYMSGGNQSFTDINAPAGICSYQIGVNINPPCVASIMPSYTTVKSNPGYVTVTGINELTDLSKAISIEPNPFNQFTKVDLHLFTKQNLKVVLIDLTGQVVMQHDHVKTDELIIERKNLSQGLYFLEVTGDGFYARKKLVVE